MEYIDYKTCQNGRRDMTKWQYLGGNIMKLRQPFIISSRLQAGLKIGDATISMEDVGLTSDGRTIYHYWIDGPNFAYENDDLKSGIGNGNLQGGFASLLGFLGSDAEKYRYNMRSQYLADDYSFDSASVVEWACQNSDEISMLALEIEETPNLIKE